MTLRGLTDTADLWKAIVDFKQRSGYWLRQNRKHIHWQKGFYDPVIRKSEDVGSQLRYIAENPVRKNLVQQWDEYPYTGSLGDEIEALMDGVSDI